MSSPTQFEKYVADEIKKYRDIAFPLRSSLLRRLLVRQCDLKQMHPNPEDEFCNPQIGPSNRIISEYMETFRNAKKRGDDICEEPVLIERMYPDGYMILNGHHRWAAAMRLGYKKIPVKIVNLTQESDIKKQLSRTTNTKRVTFDLDEVVFLTEGSAAAEKPLRFPFNLLYKEPLRRGIPALFNFLSNNGYDVWVYTNNYYSFEHIRSYFRHYHASVTGVITGLSRKTKAGQSIKKKIDTMMADRYQTTLHIDNDVVLRTSRNSKQFDEYSLDGASDWGQQIVDIVKRIESNEKQA